MPPPIRPEIYRFNSVSTLHSVGDVAKAYAEQKYGGTATKEQIRVIIRQIVKETNEAINKGIIKHKLYDPNKTGQDQVTGKWFNKGDVTDIDLVGLGDQIVVPKDIALFAKDESRHIKPNDPALELKKKLNANTGNKKSNSNETKDAFKLVAGKLGANERWKDIGGQTGHLAGSVASSSITVYHGVYSYDTQKDFLDKDNLKATAYGVAGAVSALNGVVCSLEDSPKRDFFKAYQQYGQEIDANGGIASKEALSRFNQKMDDLLQKIESPSTRQRLAYWLGRSNEQIFWKLNSGHKDMFNGMGMMMSGITTLGFSINDIINNSRNGEHEFTLDKFYEAGYKELPNLAKSSIATGFGYKAWQAYDTYEQAYKVQANKVTIIHKDQSPQALSQLRHEEQQLTRTFNATKAKITTCKQELKYYQEYYKKPSKSKKMTPSSIAYKIKELKTEAQHLTQKLNQTSEGLNSIKNIHSSIISHAQEIEKIKKNVDMLRGIADTKAAGFLKKGFVGIELITGTVNLVSIKHDLDALDQEKASGNLNEHDYQVLQIAGKMKAATTIASTTASLALFSAKISSPVGWGVAIADCVIHTQMPKQSEIDRACLLVGLRPEFNPYALDNHSPLAFTAGCVATNTLRDALTYSLDASGFKSAEYCRDYQKMADQYWEVTWNVMKHGNANMYESETTKLFKNNNFEADLKHKKIMYAPNIVNMGEKIITIRNTTESTAVNKAMTVSQ